MLKQTLIACCVVSASMLLVARAEDAAPTSQPTTQPAAAHVVGVDEFDKLRADPANVLIDVRTPEEFARGHIPGATNLPIGGYFEEAFADGVAKLDPNKTYLVYCGTGKRSANACSKMSVRGATLYDLDGGIRAWTKAGKPVEK